MAKSGMKPATRKRIAKNLAFSSGMRGGEPAPDRPDDDEDDDDLDAIDEAGAAGGGGGDEPKRKPEPNGRKADAYRSGMRGAEKPPERKKK